MSPATEQIPPMIVAASANGAGTVTVYATDQGLPVEIRVTESELRYGAQPLAEQILRLTRLAATEAGVRRRELLSAAGMPAVVVDRLGLPTRNDLDSAPMESGTDPFSWLRQA